MIEVGRDVRDADGLPGVVGCRDKQGEEEKRRLALQVIGKKKTRRWLTMSAAAHRWSLSAPARALRGNTARTASWHTRRRLGSDKERGTQKKRERKKKLELIS